jgi:parallel beta-helix repeat protein
MKKKIVIGIVLLFLCTNIVNVIGTNDENKLFNMGKAIITVDNEGDGDYTSIQDAIDSSNSGDTIKIYSGQYNETVVVNTESITIEGINYELGTGDDEDIPIVNGQYIDNVVKISADNVTLKTIVTINSKQAYFYGGIKIYSSHNTIAGCGTAANYYGLINYGMHNEITQNVIAFNAIDGVFNTEANNNLISNNYISENGVNGIYLFDSESNTISDNTITLNEKDGIHIFNYCHDNQIINNFIKSNSIDGVKIFSNENSYNTIRGNEINSQGWNGIHFMKGYNNYILDNEIDGNNWDGIHFGNSDSNEIIGNTISYSANKGIYILYPGSVNNQIYYNNIMNNAFDTGSNTWDNGYPYGGNHWTYYGGDDDNGDGIGDTPFDIPGGSNQDRYPIMNTLVPPNKPNKPVGTSIGAPGISYNYYTSTIDLNNDRIQYGWDWDGDKKVDYWTDLFNSGEICNVPYYWDERGSYTVYVTAMDERGMQGEWSDGLIVIIPRSKIMTNSFLTRILDRFPILQKFIGRLFV